MTFLRIAIVSAFFLSASTLMAQWTNVAPNLLPTIPSGGGAMTYSDGRIWAAFVRDLYVSSDNGTSWSKRTPNFSIFGAYRDIAFFDRNTGVVIVDGKKPMITRDGGLTWSILSGVPNAQYLSARFIGSDQEIVVCGYSLPFISVTRDGGATWNTSDLWSYGSIMQLQIGKNNTIYALADQEDDSSRIIYSHDYGLTWERTPTSFDFDCYSFALDPCDTNVFYIANEELFNPKSTLSEFLFTTDRGVSWRRSLRKGGRYTAGSLVMTPGSNIYMQTFTDGIVRTTDLGSTWTTIGGPGGGNDSRTIVTTNENTVFAIDEKGSIWRTTNSGGDSITSLRPKGFFLTSKDTLFLRDNVELCYASASDTIHFFSGGGCGAPPAIASITADSADYLVKSFNNDSSIVTFTPTTIGKHKGTLVITFTDGTSRRIELRGTGFTKGYILSASADTLFARDTLFGCESSDSVIALTISGCPTPLITSQQITGAAALDYIIVQTAPDSLTGNNFVTIRFSPTTVGNRDAEFHLTMADGADVKIILAGVCKPTLPLTLATTSKLTTDTIGGLVSVPIIMNGLAKKDDIELTVFFDKELDYIGTTSLRGTRLDVGAPTDISSVIRIPASERTSGAIVAYANFNVFADSAAPLYVRFDSLRVITMQSACNYMTDIRATSEITNTQSGCGISAISRFAHYSIVRFGIFPNPAATSVTIIASKPLSEVMITVSDALGNTCISKHGILETTTDMDVESLSAGIYLIRINSEGRVTTLPMVVEK